MKSKISKGFSLIEIMVVVTIFALLGVLVTQSLALSIRGSKKSESSTIVRSALSSAMAVIERQLRNANSVTTECASPVTSIEYVDQDGVTSSFTCSDGNIASGSGEIFLIDSQKVGATCEISCSNSSEGVPDSVTVTLTGRDINMSGVEQTEVTMQSRILLRNY